MQSINADLRDTEMIVDGNLAIQIDGDFSLQLEQSGEMSLQCQYDGESELILEGEAVMELPELSAEFGIVTEIHGGAYPAYTGPTAITPSEEEQVLDTTMRTVTQNIVIAKIPENYGRLIWNGNKLTVY